MKVIEELVEVINGNHIKMVKSDNNDSRIEKIANDIVVLMTENSTLERILLECISSFTISIESTSYDFFIKRIEREKKDYSQYLMQLVRFKTLYSDLIQISKLQNLCEEERENYCDWVNKIRGTILEKVTEKKAAVNKKQYMSGCYIEINGKKIKGKIKQSVDFAGHDFKEFQLFECKVTPNGFDTEGGLDQISLLINLDTELSLCKIRSKLFCVTAGSRTKLEVTLRRILDANYIRVNSIGLNELIKATSF